jgi:hypothetical protein
MYVVILFTGAGASKIFWQYNFNDANFSFPLKKNNFMLELSKIGKVYSFNYEWSNVNDYYTLKTKKQQKNWEHISKKYKPYTSNFNFNLEDFDPNILCEKVYDDVIQKYGSKNKYVVIGHSYGGLLALHFSKMYKNKCVLCVNLDNAHYVLRSFKEYVQEYKKVKKYIKNNNDLHEILKKIKNSKKNNENVNKYIELIHNLHAYSYASYAIKYYDNKIYIPTLFFRAYYTNPNKEQKENNDYAILEKKNLEKNNNSKIFQYFTLLDANHFIWEKQEYMNMIIYEIKNFINRE